MRNNTTTQPDAAHQRTGQRDTRTLPQRITAPHTTHNNQGQHRTKQHGTPGTAQSQKKKRSKQQMWWCALWRCPLVSCCAPPPPPPQLLPLVSFVLLRCCAVCACWRFAALSRLLPAWCGAAAPRLCCVRSALLWPCCSLWCRALSCCGVPCGVVWWWCSAGALCCLVRGCAVWCLCFVVVLRRLLLFASLRAVMFMCPVSCRRMRCGLFFGVCDAVLCRAGLLVSCCSVRWSVVLVSVLQRKARRHSTKQAQRSSTAPSRKRAKQPSATPHHKHGTLTTQENTRHRKTLEAQRTRGAGNRRAGNPLPKKKPTEQAQKTQQDKTQKNQNSGAGGGGGAETRENPPPPPAGTRGSRGSLPWASGGAMALYSIQSGPMELMDSCGRFALRCLPCIIVHYELCCY